MYYSSDAYTNMMVQQNLTTLIYQLCSKLYYEDQKALDSNQTSFSVNSSSNLYQNILGMNEQQMNSQTNFKYVPP